MRRVIFERRNGGLGRQAPTDDGISALIFNAVAVSGKFALGTTYELRSVQDAELLGLDADYDSTNKVLVYHHISEFYRLCPGAILFIRGVAQSVTMTQMCDKANAHLKKMLTDQQGKIKQVGVILNPAPAYEPTITTGLDADVIAAIAKAEQLAVEEEEYYRPVDILLEGKYLTGTATAVVDLHTQNARNVSIVVIADNDVSKSDTAFDKYAAVGTVMGCVAFAKVNENIGWAEKFNIQSVADGCFINPGLSSGLKLSDYSETDQETFDEKGYIIPELIQDETGVFINDSWTCTDLEDDFYCIENNRVIKKAIRLTYKALAPKVKRPNKVDKTTGYLPVQVTKYYQSLAKKALEALTSADECSDIDAYMNPKQNLLADNELVIEIEIIPTGTARKLRVPIGFKNPYKA